MAIEAATFTETVPARSSIPEQSCLHTVCEYTEDWSVCGIDVRNEEWGRGDGEEDCAACEDFYDENFCAHCAMGGGL